MRAHIFLLIIVLVITAVSPAVWSQPATDAIPGGEKPAASSSGSRSESPEIGQMPGFPIVLKVPDTYQSEYPEAIRSVGSMFGVVLADLDGDGDQEVVFSGQYCSWYTCDHGFIWAWEHTGELIPGFPVSTGAGALLPPSVGDLDGDGTQEIVQVTINETFRAGILVVDHLGAVVPGFPISVMQADYHHPFLVTPNLHSVPTLYDLDLDGAMEIIYASFFAIHVFEADGTQWTDRWPINLAWSSDPDRTQGSTPAVADMDGDGAPEVFVTGSDTLYMFEASGELLDGWPVQLPEGRLVAQSAVAVADLDGDTDLEVIIPVDPSAADEQLFQVKLYVYHHDGTMVEGWPQRGGREYTDSNQCPPIVTDLEGDGELEILIAVARRKNDSDIFPSPLIYAWDASGNRKPDFRVRTGIPVYDIGMLTAADVNGDGMMEVFGDPGGVYGPAAVEAWDGRGYILGTDANGEPLPGFPLRPEGWIVYSGAVIGDVDADGDYEIASVGYVAEGILEYSARIYLFDLTTPYLASNRDWKSYHSVNERGGVYKRGYRGWRVVHAGSRRGGGR